jgi:O-antigen/teichoic acid export membrane protein
VLPLLKVIHYFLSDTLTGAGYQSIRTFLQAGVAVLNILLNLWIIPAYSWRGAAWSSIASDAVLVLGVSVAVRVLDRRPRVDPLKAIPEPQCEWVAEGQNAN